MHRAPFGHPHIVLPEVSLGIPTDVLKRIYPHFSKGGCVLGIFLYVRRSNAITWKGSFKIGRRMPTLEGVVTLLSKSDGRDLVMKAGQNTALLISYNEQLEKARRDDIRSVGWTVLDARALLWMGRWLVHVLRIRGLFNAGVNTISDGLSLAQYTCFGVFFILDNLRWLVKHKVLPAPTDMDELRKIARKIQITGYLCALIAELRRSPILAKQTIKSACDLSAGVISVTSSTATYEAPLCGLISSILGVQLMYAAGVVKQ
eukprot:TRINITY_DN10612_c0_g1_i1.p1 TRINITY_DN10612_c0_g1~~TRINITY_DN10612_c0_g1_i1.p1  ORF type:complete len:260 (+),score=25.75 TRINITY_DN10612_c0_g1_i1:291-1070(+)